MSSSFVAVFTIAMIFGIPLAAIAMIFGIPLAAVVGGVVIEVVKITRTGSGARGGKLREQEEQLLQEIYRGLQRMDTRVDALETILLSEESKTTKGTTT